MFHSTVAIIVVWLIYACLIGAVVYLVVRVSRFVRRTSDRALVSLERIATALESDRQASAGGTKEP